MKLSDKIVLIFFVFTSILVVMVLFFVGGSLERILVVSAAIYAVSFLFTYLIGKSFSRQLTNLAFKVEQIAAGDLSSKLKVKGRDEISQLCHALNELISRLETGIAQDVSRNRGIDQAKTDFVAIASHQLRTPLSIIKWYIDFLISEDAGDLTDDQKKYLREVYTSNERLIELVNGLLDVSRIDLGTFAIEPEPADMVALAREAVEKFRPQIEEKGISLETQFDNLPVMSLDPRLTKIVFENILSNAVKYTPEHGRIRLIVKKTANHVLIKISDTGCGIPRAQQPQIFTKLFRADNVKKFESIGTGLGLYVAKAVIEKSGGRIWFESPSLDLLLEESQTGKTPLDKMNKGTTFFITIPLTGMKKKKGTKKLASLQ
jgi:signal transduction histidine kinase